MHRAMVMLILLGMLRVNVLTVTRRGGETQSQVAVNREKSDSAEIASASDTMQN